LRGKVLSDAQAIGEDPNESLAKFKQDYEAALPNLSPDQLVAWKQFGVDLFSLNQQVSGAAQSYSKFIAQFTASPLSKFE
jgi:hypothetical protein